jgi:hypothetical protein
VWGRGGVAGGSHAADDRRFHELLPLVDNKDSCRTRTK